MRKFLYLCLMGTALVGSASLFQARAEEGSGLVGWIRGDGMSRGERAVTALPRAAVNIGRGTIGAVVDGATALGSGIVSGGEYVVDGVSGLFSPSAPTISVDPVTGKVFNWDTGVVTDFNAPFGESSFGLFNSGTGTESGGFFSGIGDTLASGYDSVSNWMVSATDGLMGAPARIGQGISDFFVDATNVPSITGEGEAGWLTPEGMWNGAKSIWNSTTEGVSNMWNGATETVSGWFSSGSSTAANVVSGALSSGNSSPYVISAEGIKGLYQEGYYNSVLKSTLDNLGVGESVTFGNDVITNLGNGNYTHFNESTNTYSMSVDGKNFSYAQIETLADIKGLRSDVNFENLNVGDSISFQTEDGWVNVANLGDGKYQVTKGAGDLTKAQQTLNQQGQKAQSDSQKATSEAASALMPDKATVFNVIQYAIVIMQALEATNQEDITKEVKVKAQDLQDSQGSSGASSIAGMMPDVALSASTISGAAQAMIALLQNNPVYPELLSDDVCLQGGNSTGIGTASGETTKDVRSTTAYKQCVQQRRSAFAHTVALSAQVIAEGSNAISAEFYDRVQALAGAAKTTIGTLGSMSVVNDSERFPYFEMVRGTALSAVQLEVAAAGILDELNGFRKGE